MKNHALITQKVVLVFFSKGNKTSCLGCIGYECKNFQSDCVTNSKGYLNQTNCQSTLKAVRAQLVTGNQSCLDSTQCINFSTQAICENNSAINYSSPDGITTYYYTKCLLKNNYCADLQCSDLSGDEYDSDSACQQVTSFWISKQYRLHQILKRRLWNDLSSCVNENSECTAFFGAQSQCSRFIGNKILCYYGLNINNINFKCKIKHSVDNTQSGLLINNVRISYKVNEQLYHEIMLQLCGLFCQIKRFLTILILQIMKIVINITPRCRFLNILSAYIDQTLCGNYVALGSTNTQKTLIAETQKRNLISFAVTIRKQCNYILAKIE
ncbi:unnamed protein product [Paramecium sonneborni]|uniref:Uncharacterized protein n=1 Tax=Paramecium sonneborni TaxID=65129 RepID=A0A8S1RPR8_9CILI|nr:unnamed protein product [Paramecium sonneborni]